MKRLFQILLGDKGENAAVRFLKKQGYRILERQHRNTFGEIDIIAMDGACIVFVEVKTRSTQSHGQPFEAVDREKQRRITRAALGWLKAKRRLDHAARFDVISIVWSEENKQPEIQHFRNAFEADGNGQFFG
ncbi:MAG: YraN family protein [Planctomycetaceae bacterium]|nr:YraN family protein [Planctomycetaceae bacterium]